MRVRSAWGHVQDLNYYIQADHLYTQLYVLLAARSYVVVAIYFAF